MGRGFIILLAVGLLVHTVIKITFADVPPVISYQGRLMTPEGVPVRDGDYRIVVSLYESPTSSSPVWGPREYATAVRNGLFSLSIGVGDPLNADIFRRETFIELRVDEQLISPRTRIHCVGYAYRAQQADTALDLSLPYSRAISTSADIIYLRNSGTGRAANFEITSATSTSAAVRGYSAGLGNAGHFEINNATNVNPSILGKTNGTGSGILGEATGSGTAVTGVSSGPGRAGNFQINNSSSNSPALRATTNGAASGYAVYASNTGLGEGVYVEVNNTLNSKPALDVVTNGTGVGGMFTILGGSNTQPALQATTSGTGPALRTDSNTGRAVDSIARGSSPTINAVAVGSGQAGHFEITSISNSSAALEVLSNGRGPVVFAKSTGLGEPAHFEITNAASGSSAIYATTNGTSPTLNVSNSGTNEVIHAEVTNPSSGSSAIYAKTVGSAPTLNVQAGSGKAAHFNGEVEVTGKVKAASFEGAMIPVAFGTVNADGSRRSGTTNWTCTYNAGLYTMRVTGVNTDNAQIFATPRLAPNCTVSVDTNMGYVIFDIGYGAHAFDFVIFKN